MGHSNSENYETSRLNIKLLRFVRPLKGCC